MLRPLSQASERMGRSDFMAIWCGQGAPLCAKQPAAALTRRLAKEACALIGA
jgi:nitronate monooxygenase